MMRELYDWLYDLYVYLFLPCKRCRKRINLHAYGGWHYDHDPPIRGGWYHNECGLIEPCL